MNRESDIGEFYRGQTLFITGATGFMGKVLVEKLLRSCPDLDTMYLLLRSKKNEHILERADKLLTDPVFGKIEKSQLAKVVPIPGDISQPGLGLSPEYINLIDITGGFWLQSRKLLAERVTTVFHSAATVRFADPMAVTLRTNLRGTAEMVRLCKEMNHLRAFVYVSTAYTHCVRSEIDETTYEMPITPEFALESLEKMTEEQLEEIAPKMMGEWPNNYAFSKALAETLVARGINEVPVVIFRPSIVISCSQEPLPGWNDNLNGPSGIVVGSSMGIIRVTNCDVRMRSDFVPADLAINAIISSAWDAAQKPPKPATILNFTSGNRNPLTWHEYQQTLTKVGEKNPPIMALWYHSIMVIRNPVLYQFYAFLVHFLPALLIDTIAFLAGKKRRMVRLNKRIESQSKLLAFFCTRQWNFDDTNVQKLIARMSSHDRELFPCDLAKLDWKTYLEVYYMGVRRYLIKDDDSTVPAALKRYQRLYYLHRGVQCALLVLGLGLVSNLTYLL
ncbi:hypothetical protein B566_EDAN012407 [Ephemera danica]|nr:hypothetical protein B566_EDAN012407 [Ephemera danica]